MTFKANWEKTSEQFSLPHDITTKMIALTFPDKKLDTYHAITGGCANLNIKTLLEGDGVPLILRVYLRDQGAAFREKHIADLVDTDIPVPKILYVGEIAGYRFSIAEFISGISLRDLLLGDAEHDKQRIMQEVGLLLAKITYKLALFHLY